MSLTGIEQIASDFDGSQEAFQKPDPKPVLSIHTQIMVSEAKRFKVHIATRSNPFLGGEGSVNVLTGKDQDPEID